MPPADSLPRAHAGCCRAEPRPSSAGKDREQKGSREGKGSMGSNGVALIGKSKPCLDPWLSTPMLSASGKPWGSGEARRAGESPADKALTHSSGLLLRCQPLSRPLLHPEVPLGNEGGVSSEHPYGCEERRRRRKEKKS